MISTTTPSTTAIAIRTATPGDADDCARIFYDAFAAIATRHAFPTEPASPEFTRWRVQTCLDHPGFHALVAERDGRVVGSVFLDERDAIVGLGPLTVDPAAQDAGVGRHLMEAALGRERERRADGVRLVQTAYHYRSLSLYAKLGFAVREPLSVVQGPVPRATPSGHRTRAATGSDLAACSRICDAVHGHARTNELADAIAEGTAAVVERDGRVAGYATGFGYGWHAVADTDDALIALLGFPDRYMGLGVLVPSRNAEVLRWCLSNGLRVVQQSTLMTQGAYQEPTGAWLPSILY
jgi:predicted N-acetyltransferase YhbS